MVQVENLKVRKKYGKQEIIDTNYIRSSTLARNRIHLKFTRKTSEDPFKEPEVQTLAPKETKPIETKVTNRKL